MRAKYTKHRSYKHFRNEGNFNELNILFTDIIYLIIKGKRRYLSTILDSATRKVVAYKISKFNDNKLVMDTLNKAIKKTKNSNNILIHSDQW
ncbi:MAG: DDE-type integrase/transposase/recombinase [Mycoplasmatales bacterium]